MNKKFINIFKILLIICFYFSASNISLASNKNYHTYMQVVDSSAAYLWNNTDGSWDNCSFYLFQYDSLGNRVQYLRKYFDKDKQQWFNKIQNHISYDNCKNVNNLFTQEWDTLNNKWINSSHDTIYFDDSNNEISEKLFQWDTLNNTWINQNYKISSYNNNKLLSDTVKNWDTVSNKWINNVYNNYTYGTDSMNSTSFLWDTTINDWTNNEKKIYTYSDEGKETGLTVQQWDTTSNTWINNFRYSLSYNEESKETEYLFQINDTSSQNWINCYRDTLSYDETGNNIIFLSQVWDEGTETWTNKSKSTNSFNKRNYITEKISYNWDNTSEIWEKYSKIEYFQSEIECNLIASITDSTNISCYGNTNGTATVNANGGIEPFFYQWDDNLGSTTSSVSNLSANIYYHITVTDSVLCQAIDSVKLSQPDELIIDSLNTTNISCYDFNDGTASVTVIGGTKPYIYLWDDTDTSSTSSVSNLSANNYYHVSVTDNNGCTTVDSIILTEPQQVVTSSISGPNNVVENDISIYSVDKTLNSVYNWSVKDGDILSGQGTDSVSVNWKIIGTQEIAVVETSEYGCDGDTVKLNINVGKSSIPNFNNNNDVMIFPNPFHNFTTIYLPINKKYYNIDVVDIQGRIVKSFHNITQNKVILNNKNLLPGLYYIRVVSNNKIYLKKILLE